jgi:DNA processing protein
MENDLLYQLALSRIPGIGPAHARKLIRHFGEAKPIFQATKPLLKKVCGAGRADAIVQFDEFQDVEKEQSFLEKYAMRSLFITDKDYPQRLLGCEKAPILLFYKGNADLNSSKIISVVGTRSPTEYGQKAATMLIKELASSGMLIISGLAYGIDAIAHQSALDNGLPTVGILGHGLDQIYPQQNAPLARQMVHRGGLLTQFNIGSSPESYNFPMRNKLVAAMSDALIVIETASRGGSMLTVDNALEFNKKVFAFPGRINDPKSSGCNALIRSGKAHLLTGAQQLMEDMKWVGPAKKPGAQQTGLFPAPSNELDLSEEEKKVLYLLRERGGLSLDELVAESSLRCGPLSMALLNLELQGWIDSRPGKIYQLRE